MMETIELEDLRDQARQVLEGPMEMARLKPGQILAVGCSSSGIDNFKIGSHSSAEMGMAMCMTLYQELKPKGIYLATQCYEHLNRALILETEATQTYGYEPMNVVPQLKAGGSFITATYATLEHSVVMEHVRAHAGIDIDNALTGMHMRDATVSARIKMKEMGSAHVVYTRTRPKFIDGIRARYDGENM